MDEGFVTMQLPGTPDAVAPDGSDVRVLLQLGRGSMAHFELAAGQVSRPVARHSVDEIWYILHGHGQMWRQRAQRQETVPLGAGTCVSPPPCRSYGSPGRVPGPVLLSGLRRGEGLR
jgi:mannose-6-phosphate isomerase-like protein (cupin superfamily)